MELEKLKKIIFGNKNVSVQHLKQFSTKLTEDATNTSVVSDLPKLIPSVYKYAVHEDKKWREAALPALTELTVLLDLNKHLKEKPWWTEMKSDILKSVDVLMSLVSTGDDQWAELWITTVMMLGSDLRSELTLLNRLLKVVEKAFKMNDEEVRYQGFECWCKLIDNFSINKQEINNKRRLALLVIPLKANNHNTQRLCASKMKTWKHLLSKLEQHNEMTVQMLVSHFLEFMFVGVGSIAPACKTLNAECATVFSQLLHTPLLFRVLPELFIKHTFVCIEHIHRDLSTCLAIWNSLLDNMKGNQWTEAHVSELMSCLTNACNNPKLGKSKTYAHMVRALYVGSHALPDGTLMKHFRTILALALEPHVLVNYTEPWCSELLKIVAETDPIQLPQNIVGDIITKLNVLAVSELFRDEKLKFLRGMWMTMTNILCKWMADDGRIGKNGNTDTDLHNILQLLFFGAASLSSTWNKLQMKSWKSLYMECVKFFSLSTDVKCDKFVSDLVELFLEGVRDKKIPLHVALDLVSIILEFHLSKDESTILPLMMEVATCTMNAFHTDTTSASALLNQYLKVILVAARSEPTLVNDILTVTDKMLTSLEETPLVEGHLEKTRNVILKARIQLTALKPSRNVDKSESPGSVGGIPPATSPTMTSFLHRLAKSKETKSKVGSPTPSQSSEVSSSPNHTPNSKKASSPFCDMKSEDFVFVPPKPRKILLTDHQKESLTTRKHDIPALYQDLSQDSSQSPFESIVTPVQVVDKEKGTTYHSPKSFKEVNFISLSPRKSLTTNQTSSTSDDKLLNNKENDCINNNTKSPVKSISKEIQSLPVAEDVALKVLQDDQKKSHEHFSEGVEKCKAFPSNTRLRSRKSLENDSVGDQGSTGERNEHSETNGDQPKELLDYSEEINKVNINDVEIRSSDKKLNDKTPTNPTTQVQTPKRSLRKAKLNISVKKSANKNEKVGNQEEQNEKEKSGLSDSRIKSPSNTTTPKHSPIRLRKRKSGVTPILTGGELVKKVRKSKTPLNSKNTPTSKSNKSITNTDTPTNTKKDDNSIKNKTLDLKNIGTEITEETYETKGNLMDVGNKNLTSVEDEGKSAKKVDTESITLVESKMSTKSEENQCVDKVGKEAEDIELITIINKDQIDLNVNSETKMNKEGLNPLNDECKQLSLKNRIMVKDNDDLINASCSPIKVVVERLPDVVFGTYCYDVKADKKMSNESMKDVEIIFDGSRSVTNMSSVGAGGDGSKGLDASCNRKSVNLCSKAVANEEEKESSYKPGTPAEKADEICNEGKNKKSDNLVVSKRSIPRKNEINVDQTPGSIKTSTDIAHSETTDSSSSNKKTRSMEKSGKVFDSENSNEESEAVMLIDKIKALESEDVMLIDRIKAIDNETDKNETNQDKNISHQKCSPVKRELKSESLKLLNVLHISAAKMPESSDSPSPSNKPKSSECTPVKSAQKQLKQTQLPFTPIQKTVGTESKLNLNFGVQSNESKNLPSKSDLKEEQSPSMVLSLEMSDKKQTPNVKSPHLKSAKQNENGVIKETEPIGDCFSANNELSKGKMVEIKSGSELLSVDNMSETRQEVQRTPEKANTSATLTLCLERTELDIPKKSTDKLPDEITESEDVIGSSQETNVTTQSILGPCRNSSVSNSVKLLSKSPKKVENTSQALNSCERVLRSSPTKTENSRMVRSSPSKIKSSPYLVTPIKKSVCRRLDVEIEESPESNEMNITSASTEKKSPSKHDSEELSEDFKLLNGENGTSKSTDNHSLPSNRISEIMNNLEDAQTTNADCSPRSVRSFKRLAAELDASSGGSPKRTLGSLRLDNNSSPISSPNSRTSQMMELAKQEKEKTVSSPVSSLKKRRILPTRVGPVTRTPKSCIIQRTHAGPSEEWVRRTYSPSASPNSSILKRSQPTPISPDCSPPSSKKKRVSFLDPPVSESLLFSKAGTGQIQRPEQKPDVEVESEEVPSQGSVGVELPSETPQLQAKVFSPLKQCSNPITDILERIVNIQWLPQLQAQLERLGVTTVGQLSCLSHETVERLPFIPPKQERLRKILQNYYNEINEKPVVTKPTCSEPNKEAQLSPVQDKAEVLNDSPEKVVEDCQPPEAEASQSGTPEASDQDISLIAEKISKEIERYPELVRKLGNTLPVDIILQMLGFAISKLKTENDKS